MRRTLKLTFICCLALVGASFGQQPSTNEPDRAELLHKLQSDKVDDRAAAYRKLSTDSSALRDSSEKAGLIELLDRESHVALNDDQEGYIEYVSELTDTVERLVSWNDQRQVCILVLSPYPPGNEISSHAKAAMPCLLQRTQSKESLTRGAGVAILVQILGAKTDVLDPATVQQTRKVVLDALHDEAFDVRASTVEALMRFGQSDMIPALEHVVETDPTPPTPNGYSIRKLANEAITAIQKRAGQN